MKIDVVTLKAFLEYTGCELYFKAQPFITSGNHMEINSVDYPKLVDWVNDFNKKTDE
tara:strand:+ start:1041 stop:1211 length:171 start_codon:yes stop_codon:yes gene_type:complete